MHFEYTNAEGIDCIVDLAFCANRCPVPELGPNTVGFRGMLDHPPWVRFFNERTTRFEFNDSEEAYETLLTPLARFRWSTWDAN